MENLTKKLRFYFVKAKDIADKINNLDSDVFNSIVVKASKTTSNTSNNNKPHNKTIKSQLNTYNKNNLDSLFIEDFEASLKIRDLLNEIYNTKKIDFIIRNSKDKYIFLFENLPTKIYKKNDANLIKAIKQDLNNILYG